MVTITPTNAATARPEFKRARSEDDVDGSGTILSRVSQYYTSSSQQQQQQQQQNKQGQFSETTKLLVPLIARQDTNSQQQQSPLDEQKKDTWNYALLIVLYTLQGIPMGLSASIPFLIQQKAREAFANPVSATLQELVSTDSETAIAAASSAAAALSYNANAIFALCSWPFSLKLLWAPIVDACFLRSCGRRKTWLVPVQSCASLLMIFGSKYVEQQLGLNSRPLSTSSPDVVVPTINVKGLTIYFFALYFLMATQDIAVDGWALTLLQKRNRGRGPVCNSIGQNIGYFLSFVGFLALNDIESCEKIWRPLFRLPSNPIKGLVSLGSFLKFMGYVMLITTTLVAIFKHEIDERNDARGQKLLSKSSERDGLVLDQDSDDENELDASEIGLKETYRRLGEVCKLPSVRWLFVVLLTYRFPTALSDNVKFLKAVEYGLSKSTTALLSPTIILPLGILVPIYAAKYWHNKPLQQFMSAYKIRTTIVPLVDMMMLMALQRTSGGGGSSLDTYVLWGLVIVSTSLQAIVSSLQFNAQMTFFAKRVDPAIGGSYMTLLNTAANLGGTWPASVTMWLVSRLSLGNQRQKCTIDPVTGKEVCLTQQRGQDPFFQLQLVFSILGCIWIFMMGKRVQAISDLPDDAWRTHLLDTNYTTTIGATDSIVSDVEMGDIVHTIHKLHPGKSE